MNEHKLRGFLISTDGRCEEVCIGRGDEHEELKGLYRVCECDVIDIVVRAIGGAAYNIVCGDEGLLKADPVCTAATTGGEPALFGNLFITRDNALGELTSLEDEDIARIKRSIIALPDARPEQLAPRILLCAYLG